MANVIIYDKLTGAVKQYLESVNTPDFPEALIVLARPKVELKYLKVEKDKLVELAQVEKDAIVASELKAVSDAEKVVTDKIDAITDIEGVKTYLKEVR